MQTNWIRITFLGLAGVLGLIYGAATSSFLIPLLISMANACVIILISNYVKESSFRHVNIYFIGLVLGYFLAQVIIMFLDHFELSKDLLSFLTMGIYLICGYLGICLVWEAQNTWTFAIPFIKLIPQANRKKDFVLDSAIVSDPRLIDLAMTGLFDSRLMLPRFILSDLKKSENRRALEIIQKLEEIPNLQLRIDDQDFPEIKESSYKLVQLARILDAHILTADPSGIQSKCYEGVKWINVFTLANALKPVVITGETIPIKIQRLGKEPMQGVGYLDDGTMVVVNGGGDYLGETIQVQVLSVKHTSTGRIIFCNSASEKLHKQKTVLV